MFRAGCLTGHPANRKDGKSRPALISLCIRYITLRIAMPRSPSARTSWDRAGLAVFRARCFPSGAIARRSTDTLTSHLCACP